MELMKNQVIAKILSEIGDYLDMEGVAFKPYAYRKAADALQALPEDVGEVYRRGGIKALEVIPGVGEAIARKIEEYVKTGTVKYWLELSLKTPIELDELLAVEGLGPRRAKLLYEKLGIRTVAQLEKAARANEVAHLEGFGEKTEKNILQGITFLKKDTGRFPLGVILPRARAIYGLLKAMGEVEKISVAGSLRRMKETIGDVDILVVSGKAQAVMDVFTRMPGIEKIWGKGGTKSSIRLAEGFDVDLRVVPKSAYGAALQYFTGSKEHNIRLRMIAMEAGMKLNEYGLFKEGKLLEGTREEDIYRHLGLQWIPPELREDRGEIEAARSHTLPELVTLQDIRGDLHCHSNWDGGKNPIPEIAQKARALGYEYVGISDHTKFLRIEHGLDEEALLKRNREIDRLNKSFKGFRILKGVEANIMRDGSIDISNEVLSQMDYVIAGIHSQLKMEQPEMMTRLGTAMENPHVDIISHPTGRLVAKREEYKVDISVLILKAKETGTVLEIDAFPDRLDLKDTNIRQAADQGVGMVIDTDAHEISHMDFMEYGVAQARRGWARKKDILNTLPAEKLLARLKG